MLCLLMALLCHVAWAEKMQPSTTLPDKGSPEHVYTMMNGNGVYANALTAPTQTPANYGQFAFYAVAGVDGAYYIYSHTAKKWLTYTKAASYSNGKDFVKMADAKEADDYFHVENYSGDFYQIRPYNTTGVAGKYLNWFQGLDGNPLDGSNTLGLWQDNATNDLGSKYSFTEVIVVVRTYTIDILGGANGQTIKIGDETYKDGDTYTIEGSVSKGDITVVAPAGQFATVAIDDVNETITVAFANAVSQPATVAYEIPVLYPAQQTAVGEAKATKDGDAYTLINNVLAASFIKLGGALYFAGSEAMDLVAGTEPFTVAFGNGDNVPASAMTLESVAFEELTGKADAVGGAEHYDGHALVANYTYTYNESTIDIVWRAVLRDGSHYLRTEMELTGEDDVDMFNIIPMIYNVDTKAAGSTPEVIGNTRGAVLMSNKIFAGLETPTAYNTVGDATGEEDKWNLTTTIDPVTVESTAWVQMTEAEANQAKRVEEATGATYPNLYAFKKEGVELVAGQKVEVTLTYKQGSNKLYIGGIDLLASNGDIAAMDYHVGYTGSSHDKNTYTFIAPNSGTYAIRAIVHNKSEAINAKSELTAKIYTPKEGVVINTDIVGIQGRWSRNTTLAAGETWKVAAVVGLIAQDGTQANADIHTTQKRRSFLAYSERERAVPWRAMSMYLAWYELQINRNNAAPGSEHIDNTVESEVLDVMDHWKSDFYSRYGISPEIFIVDDGWDKYGEWTFHPGFPDELRNMSVAAKEMGAGIGAWLGPVGGYGQSGNYRRQYWNDKGGMQLSNPLYYAAFKKAAHNLVKNQGDNYLFFKFDGISAQFSATGPDAGDTGNENAEGIIRLEQYVREELREDIFFNTSVGTWASPFWYQITDATWRQENDHDRTGNNSINRENWITYRDRLVYQNYVKNSPICPINTLMTHGFILTKFGPPAGDSREYIPVRNELRAAFLCGSGMVELYNDYDLMNSINGGALWADLAECIAWQKRNADVLPDAHWVGGNPWTGSAAEVYGWAAWNGTKSSLALRNGANDAQTFTFTLRSALNIPANVNGSIILRSAFGDQAALEGLTEGKAYGIDETITVTLPGSSVYGFEGINSGSQKDVSSITLTVENEATEVMMGNTLVLRAAVNTDATFPAIAWTSSDPEVATVVGGLVKPLKEGEVTITATAKDGSNKSASVTITVTPKAVDMDAPVVTDLIQLSNDKVYTLSSARAFLFYKEGADKLYSSNGTAVGSVTLDKTNPNHQFCIEKIGDNYYLYSVGAEKYVAKDGSYVATATDALTLTDVSSTNANYPWQLALGGNGMNSQDGGQTAEGIVFNSYNTTDDGNCYKIEVGVPKGKTYTVDVVGSITGGVVYDGKDYKDEETLEALSLTADKLEAIAVDGYTANIAIDQEKCSITVTYEPDDGDGGNGGNGGDDIEVSTEDALPGDGTLRFYRLAIPVTMSAYTEDLGSSYDNVLAFWQECEDFVNEVFIPLGMCFDVVESESLVNLTDLTIGNSGLPEIGNCTSNLNDIIGESNYDVGMWVTHRDIAAENSGLSVEGGAYISSAKGSGYAKTDKWVVAHEIGHLFGAPHTTTGEGSLMDSGGDDFFAYPSIKTIRNKAKGTSSYKNVKVDNNAPKFNAEAMQKTYRIPQGACLSIDVQATDAEDHRLLYTAIGCSSANVGNIIEGGFMPSFASFVPQESNVINYQPRYTADVVDNTFFYLKDGTDVPKMAAGTYPLSILVNDVPAKGKYNYASLADEPFYSTYAIWEANVEIVSGTAFKAALSPAKTAYTAGEQVTVSWGVNSSYFTADSRVRISLSTDYGKTFSHVLAESVPALTGSYTVTMPNVNVGTVDVDFTTAVRQKAGGIIKVEEIGGAAYTLTTLAPSTTLDPSSNNSFTITGGADEPKAIEATISKYEVGTFYANEAMTIPSGVTAYVATTAPEMNGTEGTITMSKIEDGIIPARTGAVIRGEQGTYTFAESNAAGTAVSGNLLVGYAGTDEYTHVPLPTDGSTVYVLTTMDEVAAFYRKEADFKLYNHKAYLQVDGAQNVRSLAIRFSDDDTTGIEPSTLNTQPSTVIYDLQGRRVLNPTKGIYIVDGKKVVK